MTGHDAFDRTLADWFEADARQSAPVADLERVLDNVRRRRPLPALLADLGSHWVGEAPDAGSSSGVRGVSGLGLRWSTALILVLAIAALVGAAILVGARLLQHSPRQNDGAFHLAYGLDGDIYVADSDAGNPVRIADGAPPDNGPGCQDFRGEGPMWSPNGRHIAYRSGCRGTVIVSDVTGKVVAEFPGDGWLVSWSPDSTRVATWIDVFNTIGIYGLDGVRQAVLSVPPGCAAPGDFDPVWSPDGQSLVVAVCQVPIDGRPAGRVALGDPRSHLTWSYSPDRAHAAYVTAESLHVAATDGSQDRVLVPSGVTFGGLAIAWSPTGDRIAFDAGPASSAANEIRMVDVLTGRETSLAAAPGLDSVHVIAFSPEGDRILFSRLDANYSGTSLWSVRVDGSDVQLLVPGTDWGDWQPLPAGP